MNTQFEGMKKIGSVALTVLLLLLTIPMAPSYAISKPKNLEGKDNNIEYAKSGRIKKIWSYIPSNVITPGTTVDTKKYPEVKLKPTSKGKILIDPNHDYTINADRKVYDVAHNVRRIEADTKYAERVTDQVRQELRILRTEVVKLRELRERTQQRVTSVAPEAPVNPISDSTPQKAAPKVIVY